MTDPLVEPSYPTPSEVEAADFGLLTLWLGFLADPENEEQRSILDEIRSRRKRLQEPRGETTAPR